MDARARKLESMWRWRQAANWSPVVWLPLVIYWSLTGRTAIGIGLAIAGLAFIGCARAIVGMSRCPGCETRFRDTPAGLRRIWNDLSCEACGLSLFELRRSRAQD